MRPGVFLYPNPSEFFRCQVALSPNSTPLTLFCRSGTNRAICAYQPGITRRATLVVARLGSRSRRPILMFRKMVVGVAANGAAGNGVVSAISLAGEVSRIGWAAGLIRLILLLDAGTGRFPSFDWRAPRKRR